MCQDAHDPRCSAVLATPSPASMSPPLSDPHLGISMPCSSMCQDAPPQESFSLPSVTSPLALRPRPAFLDPCMFDARSFMLVNVSGCWSPNNVTQILLRITKMSVQSDLYLCTPLYLQFSQKCTASWFINLCSTLNCTKKSLLHFARLIGHIAMIEDSYYCIKSGPWPVICT